MNKNTMYGIVAAVVIVVVVAAVAGAYVLMNSGGGGEGNGNGNVEDVYTVENATSLQFSVDVTPAQGEASTVNYLAKNTGSSSVLLRVEIAAGEMGDLVYIFNGAEHKAWTNVTGTWEDISGDFATNWDQWNPLFEGYVDSLSHWESGEYTYTADNGDSVRVYGIIVNPTFDDSLFAAPA